MASVVALSTPAVASVAAARPQRRAPCCVARPASLRLRASAPLRQTARSAPLRTRTQATDDKTEAEAPTDTTYTSNPNLAGTIFGTYLQLGVWICTLSFAGYTAYIKGQEDPSAVGVLAGPPAAAIFLIGSFLTFKFITNKAKQEKRAAKAEAEASQE